MEPNYTDALTVLRNSCRTTGELRAGLLTISQLTVDWRSSLLFLHVSPLPVFKIPLTTLLFGHKSETFQRLLTSPAQYFPSPSNTGSRRSCSYRTSIPVSVDCTVRPRTIISRHLWSSCAPLGLRLFPGDRTWVYLWHDVTYQKTLIFINT
jgi:hypothetical protein